MKCEEVDKLLHPFFDGELSVEKSKQIEEHLLTCQRCAAKLQELENLEEGARRIRMPEPSSEYWKTFTERVRNEIILRRRKTIWTRVKSAWESFFFYSPVRLRIAAGIASIFLVFLAGKLFWDYKGREFEKIRSERLERAVTPPAQSKMVSPAPVTKTPQPVKENVRETTLSQPPASQAGEEVLKAPALSESLLSSSKEKKDLGTGEGKTILSKPSTAVTAERPKIEPGVSPALRSVTREEFAAKSPSLQETTLFPWKKLEKQNVTLSKGTPASARMGALNVPAPSERLRYYKVDSNWVRALTDQDTLIEADTLKKVISTWKSYFETKPASEWAAQSFEQVEIGYRLLFLKTKDRNLLGEGIKLLKKCETKVTDQKVKQELSQGIARLEALKKK